MERLGLGRFFRRGEGAFGCDAEERVKLIGLARKRAGGWRVQETVAIGDTPRDVASAHKAGVRSIVIRSPRASGEQFNDADAVVDDMDALARALLDWS